MVYHLIDTCLGIRKIRLLHKYFGGQYYKYYQMFLIQIICPKIKKCIEIISKISYTNHKDNLKINLFIENFFWQRYFSLFSLRFCYPILPQFQDRLANCWYVTKFQDLLICSALTLYRIVLWLQILKFLILMVKILINLHNVG